jgi:hypothetical protein
MRFDLGTFDVKSGELIVSDPCYGHGVQCQGRLAGAKNGKWFAAVDREDVLGWGTRNSTLVVWHDGPLERDARWEEAEFDVGVDSGQAGFWDLPTYGWGEGECGDTTTFYGKACSLTVRGVAAGVMVGGVVSASGFGDGGYTCSFIRNDDGEVVAARIVFIGEVEDDAEPDVA